MNGSLPSTLVERLVHLKICACCDFGYIVFVFTPQATASAATAAATNAVAATAIRLQIIFSVQGILDKPMHFLPQLSDFVPLKNGLYSFRGID